MNACSFVSFCKSKTQKKRGRNVRNSRYKQYVLDLNSCLYYIIRNICLKYKFMVILDFKE